MWCSESSSNITDTHQSAEMTTQDAHKDAGKLSHSQLTEGGKHLQTHKKTMWQLSHYQEHSNRALGHFLHRSETHPHKALIQCSQQLYLEFKTGTNPAWLSSVNQQLSKAWCLTPGYLSQQHKGWCRPRVNLQEAARAGKSQSRGRHAWKHAWNNKILKQSLYSCLLEVKVWMGGIGYKVATGGCLWQWSILASMLRCCTMIQPNLAVTGNWVKGIWALCVLFLIIVSGSLIIYHLKHLG